MPEMPDAVSIREAAVLTGRSEAAIYHLIATSQLPAQPTMSRGLAIDPRDLWDLERSSRAWWHQGHQWGQMWQRSQSTLRQLGAGVRHLFTSVPPSDPGLPRYWFPPLFM